MDDVTLLHEKLDPALLALVTQDPAPEGPLSVMVQTVDGLKDDDRRMLAAIGAQVKADLYIVNAFSTDLTVKQIHSVVLSPRVVKIFYDAPVKAL